MGVCHLARHQRDRRLAGLDALRLRQPGVKRHLQKPRPSGNVGRQLEPTITTTPTATESAPQRRVRRADRRFVRLLLIGVSLYVLAALFFAFNTTLNPAWAKIIIWLITMGGLLTLPSAGVIVLIWRPQIGHPKRRRTNTDALFCMAWITLVTAICQFSGFWNVPNPTPRFIINVLVAAAPLAIVAWLVNARGMASRRGLRRALPVPPKPAV